jgi:hypothetical protein
MHHIYATLHKFRQDSLSIHFSVDRSYPFYLHKPDLSIRFLKHNRKVLGRPILSLYVWIGFAQDVDDGCQTVGGQGEPTPSM